MTEKNEKDKALDAAIAKIEKEFGKGSIMKMGEDTTRKMDVIPTGSIEIDIALGVGGIPRGRIIEIYGPESSGKTTVALHIVAETQKLGGNAAFIDAEHALDPEYSKKLGVDMKELLVSQPDTGEEALEIAEMLVRSNAVDIIVIDSVAALVPKAEIEGAMGDSFIGLQARLMSQALRKITGAIAKSNTTVIFINQLREKVGVMFGSPETTTGGRALKFYSSIRLDIRKADNIKKGDEFLGNKVRAKVVKNKVAPPFKTAEFDIMYGQGISKISGIVDTAANADIIQKAGSWYSYKDDRMGQGKEAAKAYLEERPEILREVEYKVRQHYNLNIPHDLKEQVAEENTTIEFEGEE
ncbi:MAG: recombinase RecA [Bacillota bacterium]|nr:recombinase RecA [Bacillota bacterium]